jgi:hypothetical protein
LYRVACFPYAGQINTIGRFAITFLAFVQLVSVVVAAASPLVKSRASGKHYVDLELIRN